MTTPIPLFLNGGPSAAPPRTLRARGGAEARLEASAEGDVLSVRSAEGALLFEHRPEEGVTVLYAPPGDLRLAAPEGAIELDAAAGVRVRSPEPVDMRSGRSVSVGVGDETALCLHRRAASLAAPALRLSAGETTVTAEELRLEGGVLSSCFARLEERAERVERRVGRLVERAREAYRDVEELAQTRAGQLRLVAREALSALGTSTTVKAREALKLRGERIELD